MRKKRITAIAISAALLLSTFSVSAMTDKEAADRAVAFGWVDSGYETEAKVTRAAFAEMLVKFAGMSASGGTSSAFDDIAAGDERLAYINTAVEQKLMSPYLNNKFDPDGVVTKQQAAKAILTVLGYSDWAEASGGYPSGYTAVAIGTDMFDGVPGDMTDVLTYSGAVRMLANSASIPICEPVMSYGRLTYEKNDDKTILTEVYDASRDKVTIISNNVTSLDGQYAADGCIRVMDRDGAVFQLRDSNGAAGRYIGYTVDVYYRETDGEDTVMYIVPDHKTTELEFSIADIDSYSNGSYSYYVDGKEKKARIANDADVIYNGKKVDDISAFSDIAHMFYPRQENGNIKDGKVRLVSTDGSSSYNLVFIDAADCYAVDHYSSENNKIYLKADKPALDTEDEDTYDIYDIEGNEMKLSDLAQWDVIEAYKAIDGSYSRYVIVRNTVEGTVSRYNKGEGERSILTINGVEYSYDDDGKITVGTTGVFLLSSSGSIVMMTDAVTHSESLGYLVLAYSEDYEETIHVRLLNTDGVLSDYECDEKIVLDGVSVSSDKLKDRVKNHDFDRQVIAYKLNGNKIKTIDTTEENSKNKENDLRVIYTNTSANPYATDDEKSTGLIYKKNLMCFGGKIIVDPAAKFMVIPDVNSPFENYAVKALSTLRNDGTYKNLTAYTIGTDSQKAKLIVQEIEGGVENDFADDSNIAIVERMSVGINPNGEEAQCMRVYVNGALQEVYGENLHTLGKYEDGRFYPLSEGDIIRYTTDSSGIIGAWTELSTGWSSTIDPLYVQSYGELERPDSFERNIYGGDRRFVCRVYDKIDGFVGVAVKPDLDQVKSENGDIVYFSSDSTNVYIYDRTKDKNKVTVGTVDDLETYKTVGNACSEVYVSAFKGELKDVVIFK